MKVVGNIECNNSKIKCKLELTILLHAIIIGISISVPILKKADFFSVVITTSVVITLLWICLLIKKESFELYQFKKRYLILFEIIGISFLFNGIYFLVLGYIAIGLVFSVVVPLVHIISYSITEFSVCRGISLGVLVSFVFFLVVSLICGSSLGLNQYTSICSNPNTVGNYMIVVNASILYLIFDAYKKKSPRAWIYFFILGLELSIMVLTNSRTTLIAVVLQLAFALAVCVVKCVKKRNKSEIVDLIKRLCLIIIIFVLMFVTVFFALTSVKKEIMDLIPSVQVQKEYEEISFNEILKRTYLRYTKGLNEISQSDGNVESDDAFTSGRKEIWKQFTENLGFMGHKEEGRRIVEESRYYAKTNAHNVYIQIGYSAGILAGIAMILLIVLAVKDVIIKLYNFVRHGELKEADIFTICSAIGFGIVSLTSAGYMLYTYLPATLFYFTSYNLSIEEKAALRGIHS